MHHTTTKRRAPLEMCDVCGGTVQYVIESAIFATVSRREWPYIYFCSQCGALVGCHPGTNNPLGYMATSAIRRLRARLHQVFDPLWESGLATRSELYVWLAKELHITFDACHIAQLSVPQLNSAIELVERYTTIHAREMKRLKRDRSKTKRDRDTVNTERRKRRIRP